MCIRDSPDAGRYETLHRGDANAYDTQGESNLDHGEPVIHFRIGVFVFHVLLGVSRLLTGGRCGSLR